MNLSLAIPMALHQIAVIIWIGGMFFAHVALRPTIKRSLEPPERIQVALGVFRRFFPWVWACIAVLWISGVWAAIVKFPSGVPLSVHLMMGMALIMTLVFVFLVVFPYRKMKVAVDYENWRWASAKFAAMRKLMAFNLLLGMLTAVIAVAGPLVIPGIEAMIAG
jgi:uncharacterized membrane protein